MGIEMIPVLLGLAAAGCAAVRKMSPAVNEPESKPAANNSRKVDAKVSRETYQKLQKLIFGSVMQENIEDPIACADVPLDNVKGTSRVELCREIAGDMEISASELLQWAVKQDESIITKYPAIASMEVGKYNYMMLFSEELPLQALETHGVYMKVPLSKKFEAIWGYDVEGDIKAIEANNESFRIFWKPDGSTFLDLQSVFNEIQNEIVDSLSSIYQKNESDGNDVALINQ